MLVAALAAALLTTPPQEAPQEPTGPVALEDITVTGRTLDRMIQDFVGEVAEPNPRRGLARWNREVCVGVANMKGEAAQYLADRVSTVAEDLGLNPGAPGCSATLLIVATDDGSLLANDMVERRRRAFRMGGSGMDRGGTALQDFIDTPRPVRWWQMAMPTDSETGMQATRIPGECSGPCIEPTDMAPMIGVFAASRLTTQITNNLIRAVVIVDVDEVSHLSIQQLADYIAMVSLAQIDPDADTSGYNSILNVLDDPADSTGLTSWDMAYLNGLYSAERNRRNPAADRSAVVDTIRREHGRLRAAGEETAEN